MIPEHLADTQLAILGLGLMGGSLAMALRPHCQSLAVYDPDAQTRALARQMAVADRVENDAPSAVRNANLIILAAPVSGILDLIMELASIDSPGSIVLDIGSTKRDVCRQLSHLPDHYDPIGGHPMTGKTASGLANADTTIFKQAVFSLTPLERTSMGAKNLAVELVQALGSIAVWLDADQHDRLVAATSHLPYLLAIALALTTPLEAQVMTGPGFRSATRLAGSSIQMMQDVLLTNRDNIIRQIDKFTPQLGKLRMLLEEEQAGQLMSELQNGLERYHSFITNG
jgi:prephenate dehydrogenase